MSKIFRDSESLENVRKGSDLSLKKILIKGVKLPLNKSLFLGIICLTEQDLCICIHATYWLRDSLSPMCGISFYFVVGFWVLRSLLLYQSMQYQGKAHSSFFNVSSKFSIKVESC